MPRTKTTRARAPQGRNLYQAAAPGATMPDCVCAALRMATRAVTQIYDDAMRPSGLRVTQYSLLARIARLEPVSAATLEDEMYADQTTLARALKVLEKDGLLRRVANPDRRIKQIELTPAGRRRLAHARELWAAAQAEIVGLIGDAAWKDTRTRLVRLLDAVADRPD
ncbi:MAG: MarR family transcriptional regulator [Alphaproteobacteria bacterium]|nr:MarR family transcriptional regulator [Alphaproteobacteria bacterium]